MGKPIRNSSILALMLTLGVSAFTQNAYSAGPDETSPAISALQKAIDGENKRLEEDKQHLDQLEAAVESATKQGTLYELFLTIDDSFAAASGITSAVSGGIGLSRVGKTLSTSLKSTITISSVVFVLGFVENMHERYRIRLNDADLAQLKSDIDMTYTVINQRLWALNEYKKRLAANPHAYDINVTGSGSSNSTVVPYLPNSQNK